MSEIVPLGIGEVLVTKGNGSVLTTRCLGSCVAIRLWDPGTRVAVRAYAVLPTAHPEAPAPFRFVESAIPALVRFSEAAGAQRSRLRVAITGGAQMFPISGAAHSLDIGARNVAVAREAVAAAQRVLAAEDAGGRKGRPVYFDTNSGRSMPHGVA